MHVHLGGGGGGGGSGQYLLNPFLIKPGIVLNHVPQCYWKSFNVLKVTGFTRSKKKNFLKDWPIYGFCLGKKNYGFPRKMKLQFCNNKIPPWRHKKNKKKMCRGGVCRHCPHKGYNGR